MFKVICKIWMFLVKLFKAVIDAIVDVLGTVLQAVLTMTGQIWTSVFGDRGKGIGSIIIAGLLGYGAWKLWGWYSDKKEKDEEIERDERRWQQQYELEVLKYEQA